MTREEEKNKARFEYVSKRLANPDFPTYNAEYELEAAFDEGIEWTDSHPHWVSVEDELPERNKWVLTFNGSSINLLMLAGNGNWYDHSVAQQRNVTHWMRIEPPAKLSSLERNGKNWKEKKGGEG